MDLRTSILNDYRIWDNRETVTFRSVTKTGGTDYAVTDCLGRAPTFKETVASGGTVRAADKVWLAPVPTFPAGVEPKPGDKITDGSGTAWTVLPEGAALNTLKTWWRLVTRSLAVLLGLREYVSVWSPAATADALGGRRPNHAPRLTGLAAKIQPQERDQADQLGRKVTVKRFTCYLAETVSVGMEDQLRDADGNVYDVVGTRQPEVIGEPFAIDLELRQGADLDSPTALLGSLLQIDARADRTAYEDTAGTVAAADDGDAVARLDSLGALATSWQQSTAGSRPTLRLGVIGSRAVLRGDGVDDYLTAVVSKTVTSFAVWVVGKSTSTAGQRNLVYLSGGFLGSQIRLYTDDATGFLAAAVETNFGAGSAFPLSSVTAAAACLVRLQWDGSTVTLWKNGTQVASAALAAGTITLGGGGGESALLATTTPFGFLAGDLAEVVFAAAKPSTAQIAAVEDALRRRFALY